MLHALQELGGEVARLRHECGYFMRALDALERLSQSGVAITESENSEIERAGHTYAWSAKENLERATQDLKNWADAVEREMRQKPLGYSYPIDEIYEV